MDQPIKIALLSLNHGHTRKYYEVLQENPKLEFVAASAADLNTKELFKKTVPGVPVYDSDEELFDKHPEIQAAILASPNCDHLRQMRLCAERGIHILSMKIPTFDMAEYDEMIRLVEQAGIVCQVELELHYNPVMQRIKDLESQNSIGTLLSFTATNITLSPVWAFPWQGDPAQSFGKRVPLRDGDDRFCGGALCDHPHIFDMIRWVTHSEFDTIYAQVAPNLRPDLEEEDMLSVIGRMKNGVTFSLDPSWSRMEERIPVPGPGWEVFPKRMQVDMTLVGDQGVLSADLFGPNIYHNAGPDDRYLVQYTYFDEWVGLIDEFVDCIENHKEPTINLKWHQNTIRAMLACYNSIRTGQPVKL